MGRLFLKHLDDLEIWFSEQSNIRVHYVSYNDLIADPLHHCEAVNRFLDDRLSVEQMIQVVDHSLYRQRSVEINHPSANQMIPRKHQPGIRWIAS